MFSRKSKSPKNINNNNTKHPKSSRTSDSTATSGSVTTTTDCNESDSDSVPSLSMLPSLVTVPSIIPQSVITGSNRNSIISSATVTLKPKPKTKESEQSPASVTVKTTRSAVPPSDLGSFRTLVSGWDSINTLGHRLTPKPSSVSPSLISTFTNVTSEATKAAMDTSSISVNSMHSSSPIPNQSMSSNMTTKSAKESFFLNPNENEDGQFVGFSANKGLRTPTTEYIPTSSSFNMYRCANTDRFSMRPGIYDLGVPSPEAVQAYTNFLNSEGNRKFTPFTPRDPNTPATTNGIQTTNSNTNPVSGFLKPVPKISENTNNSSIPTSVMSSIPTSIKEPANYLLSKSREMTERAREDLTATVEGRKEFTSSMVRDTDVIVGFSDLPNQIHRKTVKKGFEFTLMVAGKSGLGKSTLVNSMFLTDIYSDEYPGPSKRASQTVSVEATKVLLKEKNVNLQLTIVDTPGYGSSVDNSNCWEPVVKHIESQYEEYLNAETKLHRKHIPDTRVHCCLYFIQPSGHQLEELDIQFMKNLHDKVNIIPVIAKADTLTLEELTAFKKNVLNSISLNKIKVYDFPDDCGSTDLSNGSANSSILENKTLKQLKSRIPFAVVGSNCIVENADGQRRRGRKYPWGIVEVENLDHSDFVALRNLLIRTYMLDLLDTTNTIHYENYRCRKLSGIGGDERPVSANRDSNNLKMMSSRNPLAQMEEEKKEHEMKMKKMESEMEQVFEQKVREKMMKLKDSETDLQKKYEHMNVSLELQRKELEQKREAYEKERAAFEMISLEMDEIRRASTLEANSRENLEKKKKKGLF